jgi:biopolymer transport protein ExbD
LHVEDSSGTWTAFPLEQASAAAAAGLKTAEPTGAIHIRADPETPFGQFMDLLRRLHESGHTELRVIGEAVRPPA